MQRNFFLTDVMKTGAHQTYERFLNTHSLPDQTIDYTGEYYTLHNYDLDAYDRKFAFIDRRMANVRLFNNAGYEKELLIRIKLLHSQGFKFIMGFWVETRKGKCCRIFGYVKFGREFLGWK